MYVTTRGLLFVECCVVLVDDRKNGRCQLMRAIGEEEERGMAHLVSGGKVRLVVPGPQFGQAVAPIQAVKLRVRRSKGKAVRCSLQARDDSQYLQAHVVEAVSMVPVQGHLYMTLVDGREVEVNHINPTKGHLLYKSSTPTIFLRMSDNSDLMLPIVVGEMAIAMLMKALHGAEKLGRPNQYQILKDIVDCLNYEPRMVRVTERVVDTYYARIYIGKPGEEDTISVDARPSDAINLAVRCKVPIYVNKSIVAEDAVKPVYNGAYQKRLDHTGRMKQDPFLDSADVEPDKMAEEITLIRNMLMAVVEERYADAARCRDELTRLRAISEWQLRQI